jgi:hypothetical protein
MIHDLAQRHGFEPEAVESMFAAVCAGRGRMAQFDHPAFGGPGQWMDGGMTMISDMFNRPLNARVAGLCNELSRLIERDPPALEEERSAASGTEHGLFVTDQVPEPGTWWPSELGRPDSAGAQDDMRYAYFAAARRLVIEDAGRVTVYDTLDHRIGSVAQLQFRRGVQTFSSQHGTLDVTSLPVVTEFPDVERR